ncbi:DUF2441 domain-containing protein [Brachyspira hyodysenteriae]|uniref:DUF2441 domain-containing protein n=1 Tax=Brachyspira hyodysenteriae TaxID=159 RepID=UPI0022CDF5C7|nr:DUF2441 domain-containing protein [Brachyspira hyodysenteriae]MDA0081048.1 DUF2441 domain-containing protein [Brachyspira hyodysenteriae]
MKEYFRVINEDDLKCNCDISTDAYNYHNSLNKYYGYDSYLQEFEQIYKLYDPNLKIKSNTMFGEFILEKIRKEYFNEKLSRLESCFVFENKNQAMDYIFSKQNRINLIIVKVIPSDNCIFDEYDISILNEKGPKVSYFKRLYRFG